MGPLNRWNKKRYRVRISIYWNLIDTSKCNLTEGTIISKAILHAGGSRAKGKALYRFLSEVVVFLPHVCAAFCPNKKDSFKGMVFGYVYGNGLGKSPRGSEE